MSYAPAPNRLNGSPGLLISLTHEQRCLKQLHEQQFPKAKHALNVESIGSKIEVCGWGYHLESLIATEDTWALLSCCPSKVDINNGLGDLASWSAYIPSLKVKQPRMAGSNGGANTGDMWGALGLWLHLFFAGKETQGTVFVLENLQGASPSALGINLWPKDAQKLSLALLKVGWGMAGTWSPCNLSIHTYIEQGYLSFCKKKKKNSRRNPSCFSLDSDVASAVLQTSHSQGDPVKSDTLKTTGVT